MTHIRNGRTSRQRRRAGTTLVLAAATGGLLAAAMAGSPTARADDPFTDIVNDVQGSITAGETDYSEAASFFSTAGDTNEGLIAAFAGFTNIFISPADYALLGLTAAGTDTDFSSFSIYFQDGTGGLTTAAGEESLAADYSSVATADFTDASSALTGGDYFAAVNDILSGGYLDIIAGQADTLAGLFSLGI
jgi:hypothetical protein